MKRILVLGGGFGGLRTAILTAKKLRRLGLSQKYEVVLIDKNDHHTYTPLLYEIATTSKDIADLCKLHEIAAYPLTPIVKPYGVTFIKDEVLGFDFINGMVHFKEAKALKGEYIVLALGAEANYFNIPGLREHSLALKTFKDAIRIRDTVWNLAEAREKQISVIIGGGGSTGVEIAGELKAWCGQLDKNSNSCTLRISIIEASLTILCGLAPGIIRRAKKRLEKLGVDIHTGQKITSVSEKEATLASGQLLPFDIFIWTGGVKIPAVLAGAPLKTDSAERISVLGKMECLPQTPDLKLYSKIYGLGDAICFYDPITQKPIPGVARAALSQATVVAHNIIEDIKASEGVVKDPSHRIYKPIEYPYIVPAGGKYAVAKIGPLVIGGFCGWMLKGLVELNYLLSIMSPYRATKTWLSGFKIFIQNDRLG